MDIIRAKSPLRVSFCGGGTDFPHFFNEHGGAVLSTTINKFAHVTLYPRSDKSIVVRSADLGREVKFIAGTTPVFDGVLDLAKAAITRLGCNRGMTLDIHSEVPPGSGLGGSSAVTSAIIGAVSEYCGKRLTPYEQSELNYKIEREDVGIPGGKQDQFATNFGGINLIEFEKDRTIVNPLRIDRNVINDLEEHLLFCYTGGVRTDLNLIDNQIKDYEDQKIGALEGTMELKNIVYRMKDYLLQNNIDELGKLLHQAYKNKKKMNPNVATGTNADELYNWAYLNGALGGKLCGAGGGGYVMIYAPTDKHHAIRTMLKSFGGRFDDITFENKGLQVWRSRCP